MVRYLLAWIPMMLIGVANGLLRAGTYGRHMAELQAHQLSTASGAALIGLYIYGAGRVLGFESGRRAVLVGAIWLLMTVGFEFAFGHYVAGHEWRRLLRDYDLSAGRLWPLFLLWLAAAPYVFHRLS